MHRLRHPAFDRIRAVIVAEMRSLARQRTPFVLRGAYVLLVAGILALVAGPRLSGQVSGEALARAGQDAFTGVAAVQMFLAVGLGALLGIASMQAERQQRTLGLLVLSQLEPRDIVVGKLFALLGLVVSVLLAGLPVFALLGWAGGVDGRFLAWLGALTIALAALGVATGLGCAVLVSDAVSAALCAAAFLAAPLVAMAASGSRSNWALGLLGFLPETAIRLASQEAGTDDLWQSLGLAVVVVWVWTKLTSRLLPWSAARSPGRGLRGAFEVLDRFYDQINVGGLRFGGTGDMERRLRGNPVTWLSRTITGTQRPLDRFRLLAGATILALTCAAATLLGGTWRGLAIFVASAVLVLSPLAAGATAFGSEKTRGALPLLLSTPLRPGQLLLGKIAASRWILGFLVLPGLAILVTYRVADSRQGDLLPFLGILLGIGVCGYSLALACSLHQATALRAGVAAGLATAGVQVGFVVGIIFSQVKNGLLVIAAWLALMLVWMALTLWARRGGWALAAALAGLAPLSGFLGEDVAWRHGEIYAFASLCGLTVVLSTVYAWRSFDRILARSP